MLCSSCNRVVKPVVAVDIDGTLGQYHRHFTGFAERYLQSDLPMGYDGSVEMHEWLGLELHEYRTIKLAYRQGGLKRSMPVYDGADLLMARLRNVAEVWIATTRPFLRLDNIDPDTRFWLDHHQFRYDGLLYGDDKMMQLREAVGPERVVAVLDDLPKQVNIANDVFAGAGLLISRHHNGMDPHLGKDTPVIGSLITALGLIEGRALYWRQNHAQRT